MPEAISTELLDKVRGYKMPARAVELLHDHNPVLIAGVTASGKGAVTKYISESTSLKQVVTHTTRDPRPGEKNGIDYWFVNNQQMGELLDSQQMIEVMLVHGHHIYGSSITAYEEAVRSNERALLIVDVQGVEEITKNVAGLKAVFLLPPSFDEWMRRLDKRGAMSHTERARRLKSSEEELRHVLKSNHFTLYVNRDVNTVSQAIISKTVVPAEQHHHRELIERLLESIHSY
jgi:guanylate kinase